MTQEELLRLTPDQKKALAQLKRAFTACEKAGLYVWDNYGTISAVNGKNITGITTDARCGELLDQVNTQGFNSKVWGSANADDPLYVQL